MMILFLLIAVFLVLFLQKRAMEQGFDDLEANHRLDYRVVEPGEHFSLQVRVSNTSKAILPFVKVEERLGPAFVVGATSLVRTKDYRGMQKVSFTSWLLPHRQVEASIPLSVEQRGRYVINGLTLHRGDFLGLEEESQSFDRFVEVVVAPKPLPMGQLDVVLGGFLGDVSARRFLFEDPVLTMGYGEYTGREPMKMISWSQSAKRNTLLVKKPDYTLEPAVSILLNVESDLTDQPELFERCISMTRSVCEMMERKKCRYCFVSNARLAGELDLMTASQEGLGERHFMGVLEQLGRATSESAFSFEQLLQMEMERPNSSGRILITLGGEDLGYLGIQRLREASGGQLLVLQGKEMSL